MTIHRRNGICVASAILLACTPSKPEVAGSVQLLRAAQNENNDLLLAMDVLVTDLGGKAVPCSTGTLDVGASVSFQGPDRGFTALPSTQMQVACTGNGLGDFALVVDNSGSENGYLPDLKAATHLMVDKLLPAGGRASLTRVSTTSQPVHELSADAAALHAATETLAIGTGWTALFDGIRVGNETLGGAMIAEMDAERFTSRDAFCSASRKLGIVAFTDGQENNSSGQKLVSLEDDGINTTIKDLHNLRVDNITTPIYTVGLGRNIDREALSGLAEDTGGRYMHIDSSAQIPQVFDLISDYAKSTFQVCVQMPGGGCGRVWVKTQYTFDNGVDVFSGQNLQVKDVPCPVVAPAPSRVATILLTLGDPGIPPTVGAQLVRQTALWVVPKANPRVLVVRDDNHHNEDVSDSEIVRDMLIASGLQTDLIEEPDGGLTAGAFVGYDVIWFSNPGYPMDDQGTFNALLSASQSGKGVVLQGDDLTWSWGQSFSMAPLTHLNHKDNGTNACGTAVDNRKGGKYVVKIDSGANPIGAGLEGIEFPYGNDIDRSVARGEGETVVSATVSVLDGKGKVVCTDNRPVVVGYQP